jgi:hypothetical protein
VVEFSLIVAETYIRQTDDFAPIAYQWPEWHAELQRSGWAMFRPSHILQIAPSTARRAG